MILSVKVLLFLLPLMTAALVNLSPPDCTLECISYSLNFTMCDQASGGLNDPSVVPCLCEDKGFMFKTVDCVLNSGKCHSDEDKKSSFIYACGLCDSAGITLPSPSDLPDSLGVSTSASSTRTAWITTVPTTSVLATVIMETITTNRTVEASIACPVPSGNMNYTAVVSNVVTTPESTVMCGNITKTLRTTTTRKSTYTRTATRPTTTRGITTIEGPGTTGVGAAGKVGAQVGGMLAFVVALMWLV